MTEAEWLATNDAEAMLEFLRGKTSTPKNLLLARAIWGNNWERFRHGALHTAQNLAGICSKLLGVDEFLATGEWKRWLPPPHQGPQSADLVREILGNPFRPILLDPTCRTLTVVSLAQAI